MSSENNGSNPAIMPAEQKANKGALVRFDDVETEARLVEHEERLRREHAGLAPKITRQVVIRDLALKGLDFAELLAAAGMSTAEAREAIREVVQERYAVGCAEEAAALATEPEGAE